MRAYLLLGCTGGCSVASCKPDECIFGDESVWEKNRRKCWAFEEGLGRTCAALNTECYLGLDGGIHGGSGLYEEGVDSRCGKSGKNRISIVKVRNLGIPHAKRQAPSTHHAKTPSTHQAPSTRQAPSHRTKPSQTFLKLLRSSSLFGRSTIIFPSVYTYLTLLHLPLI